MALGFFDTNRYRPGNLRLRPGDVVVLYTDGVSEATNAAGEMFGEKRLAKILAASRGLAAGRILEAIQAKVGAFCGDRLPNDDVTLLILKYLGPASKAGDS
jgi:sigma-B regulation protein RsbU (phosphoserine phosphatase)